MNLMDRIAKAPLRRDLPPFRPGDTVRVHVRVTEGDKQRIQVFEGVVLRRRGRGPSATFTVRKISSGVGVERIFPIESPNVTKLEIKSRGHVRRARLYYLRDLRGKKARLRSKVRDLSALVAPEPPSEPEEAGSAEAVVEAEVATEETFEAPEVAEDAAFDAPEVAKDAEPAPAAEASSEAAEEKSG